MYYQDYLNCRWRLIEVLIQFDGLKDYSEFLERHLDWPKRVELQKADEIIDFVDRMQEMDAIEYKYSIFLPIRFSYSYVIQFCSMLEWSLERILLEHKIAYQLNSHKGKINQLINIIKKDLNIFVKNQNDINEIVKARNLIVHMNGNIDVSEKSKWENSSLYSPVEVFDEIILQINNAVFFRIYLDCREWIAKCCI